MQKQTNQLIKSTKEENLQIQNSKHYSIVNSAELSQLNSRRSNYLSLL